MTLVKYHPRRRYASVNLDPFFNAFLNNGNVIGADHIKKSNPAINIVELEDSFRIELAAPGLSKKDFQINVEKDELTVSVNKELKSDEATETYKRREFSFHSFERSFHLPDTIDTDAIQATYKNGVLNIVLAKKEEAKEKPARLINVG